MLHTCEDRGAGGAPDCAGGIGAGTVLHPEYAGTSQRILSDDDVAGVCFLYPRGGCEVTGCAAPLECIEGSCELVCEGAVCSDGERCGPMGCEPAGCTECGPGAIGDPCDLGADCTTGFCSSGGYCTEECIDACRPGFACQAGECVAAGGVFGEECANADECLSDLCLQGAEPRPICTRACLDACPGSFICGPVDGRDVCRPAPLESGCSATGDASLLLCLSLLGILVVLRRRTPEGHPS